MAKATREFGSGDMCDWCGKEGRYAYLYASACLCADCAATERGGLVNAENEVLIAAHYGVLDGADAKTLTQGIRQMVAERERLREHFKRAREAFDGLCKYADHWDECLAGHLDWEQCTCGYDDAVTEMATALGATI